MFFIVLFILLSAIYSYLFTLIPLSLWFLFLWIPLGILGSLLTILIFALLFLWIGSKTKPKHKFKHFVLRNACWLSMVFLHIHLEIEGKENIPQHTFVVYANHKSNMDPVMIYYAMHKICSAIGKKTLFVHPIMKLVCKTYDAVPMDRENDREAAKALATGIKKVKNGLSMIIFPEGGIKTRETEEMVNLRPGAYKLATKAEAPILPISIVGSSKIKTKKRRERITVRIIFHKPIEKEEYQGLNTTELGLRVEEIINAGVRNAQA